MARDKAKIEHIVAELVALTGNFCDKYLNEEYKALCSRLICKLARKRTVPFFSGRLDIWAAAVIYALGQINFLFDNTMMPHMSATKLCKRMGTNPSTTSQKAKVIRDILHLRLFDPAFSTQDVRTSDPLPRIAAAYSPPYIQNYQQIRRAQMELQQRIINQYATRPIILTAGNKLGILRGDCLCFETEDEVNVVMDLAIYEEWEPHENAIQRYHDDGMAKSDIERVLLDGMLHARTSLFEVQAINGIQLILRDLLQDSNTDDSACTSIVEIGLSQSGQIGLLIFIRLIPLGDYGITSGIIFPFNAAAKTMLLNAYEQQFSPGSRGTASPVEKFALFFKLYHEHGISFTYNYV